MDFELDEEQRALKGLMKEFCLREVDRKAMDKLADEPIPPNATKADLMARIPWDLISKMHDVGLRQLAVPREYGEEGTTGQEVGLPLPPSPKRPPTTGATWSAGFSPCPGTTASVSTMRRRPYRMSFSPIL